MTEYETVDLEFQSLRSRLKDLQRRLNPDDQNLHLSMTERVSAADFADFQCLGADALERTRAHWGVFCESPYAGDMFWYEFMLLVSAAARARLNGLGSESVDLKVLFGLLEVVVDVCECMIYGGDSTKRTGEALGNLLLAFPDQKLIDFVRERSGRFDIPRLRDFLEWQLARVESHRERKA